MDLLELPQNTNIDRNEQSDQTCFIYCNEQSDDFVDYDELFWVLSDFQDTKWPEQLDNERKNNVKNTNLDSKPTSEAALSQCQELDENQNTTVKQKYKCVDCGLIIASLESYKLHLATHPFKFICSLCPFKTRYKVALSHHLETHAADSSKIVKCPVCWFITQEPDTFQAHLQVHYKSGIIRQADQDYNCSQCDFTTRWKWNLIAHINRHADDPPFKCDRCSFATKTARCLKKHKLLHIKEPIRCEESGCTFSTTNQLALQRHSRITHFKHLLQCSRCDFSTYNVDEYAAHKQVHVLKPEFLCQLCSKKFKYRSKLKEHLLTHTGSVSCELCTTKCKGTKGLAIHMKKKHNTSFVTH